MKWGEEHPRQARPSPPSRFWAPSASPSTPRPGCGTTRTSAAPAAPIVDTYWQTETGGHVITPLPRGHPHQARLVHRPLPLASTRPSSTRQGEEVPRQHRRPPRHQEALAGHAPRHPRRPKPVTSRAIGPASRTPRPASPTTSPPTGPEKTTTDAFWVMGARWTTSSMSAATGWGRWRVESALVSHPAVAEGRGGGHAPRDQGHRDLRPSSRSSWPSSRDASPTRPSRPSWPRTSPRRSAGIARPGRGAVRRDPAQDQEREDHAPAAAGRGRGAWRRSRRTRPRWRTSAWVARLREDEE